MRAVLRFGKPLVAAGLALAPAVALAQQAPPPATSSPDAVGPKALQDFSLSGTVTRPADQQPVAPQPPTRQSRAETQPPVQQATARSANRSATPAPVAKHTETAAAEPSPRPQPAPPTTAPSLPSASSLVAPGIAARTPAAAPSFAPDPQPSGAVASAHSSPMLIWLFEALVLALAGAFLFWRTRGRELFAGSARFDLFTEPELAPAPSPAPAPAPRAQPQPVPRPSAAPPPPATPKPAAPASTGVVSTSLRPWIEIGFQPVRCVLEDQRVAVEFDLELFNSGSAPARAVLVEARLFNAGAEQDSQIAEFFGHPLGLGERIAVIPPLKRMAVRTQAFAPREQIQTYELAGRPVFVPLIAFNVLYSWSGGEGQTSVSHLLGRDTKGEKLGPFHLDLGPHIFRNLAARLLPTGVRR